MDQWEKQGVISGEQRALLGRLSRGQPFSISVELNVLLYLGVLAFIAGLGWTLSTWSRQWGDVFVVVGLSVLCGSCHWYCFARAPAWSAAEVLSPGLVFDYVLYLGALIWSLELAYVTTRFPLLSGYDDLFWLVTAGLFFFLAYRFDNRFVLSLAFTSLAAWFGITISGWPSHQEATYRVSALLYSVLLLFAGAVFERRGWKTHFFPTYLNVAANILFWAVLSGVFQRQATALWLIALLVACGASLAWGLPRRQFLFVAYAAVYGYVGVSWMLVREIDSATAVMTYFIGSGAVMLVVLVGMARRFGRES